MEFSNCFSVELWMIFFSQVNNKEINISLLRITVHKCYDILKITLLKWGKYVSRFYVYLISGYLSEILQATHTIKILNQKSY